MDFEKNPKLTGQAFADFIKTLDSYGSAVEAMRQMNPSFAGEFTEKFVKKLAERLKKKESVCDDDIRNHYYPELLVEIAKESGLPASHENGQLIIHGSTSEEHKLAAHINGNINAAYKHAYLYMQYFDSIQKDKKEEFLINILKRTMNYPGNLDDLETSATEYILHERFVMPAVKNNPDLKEHLVFFETQLTLSKIEIIKDLSKDPEMAGFQQEVVDFLPKVDLKAVVKKRTKFEDIETLFDRELGKLTGVGAAQQTQVIIDSVILQMKDAMKFPEGPAKILPSYN